jgi:hypothetical protein
MKKITLLLFITALFQINAQNKYLKKMGGVMGNYFIFYRKKKIDFSKSFTIQYVAKLKDEMSLVAEMTRDDIINYLEGKSEIMDLVKKDGDWVCVSDYLIFITNTGVKIIKGNEDVLHVFIKNPMKFWRKRAKEYTSMRLSLPHILERSSEEIINVY